MSGAGFETAALTPERWDDLEAVFGPNGACMGCWCMYWRVTHAEWDKARGAPARDMLRAIVDAGPPPGLIGYDDGEPAGWVQVGPRAATPQWNGARRLSAPTADVDADDPGVWAVTCFVTRPRRRRQGVGGRLLEGAVAYARERGARLLEACPVAPDKRMDAASLYHGVASTFARAGFVEIARRRANRPLMRLEL